jgi:micrococcal nuclease
MSVRHRFRLVALAVLAAMALLAPAGARWLAPPVAPAAAAPGTGRSETVVPAQVVRVFDGDTLEVEIDGRPERVRLLGIDTPERARGERSAEPFSRRATEYLRRRVGNDRVELVSDPRADDRDTYGRLLRYVRLPGASASLNEELLERGLAVALTRYPLSHRPEFRQLEAQARAAGAGMWSPEALRTVGWREAPEHDGEPVRVSGRIVATHCTDRMCFLNFHRNYRRHLTAVVFDEDFEAFPRRPDRMYAGADVEIVGRITHFHGRPQIVVRSPDQVRLR